MGSDQLATIKEEEPYNVRKHSNPPYLIQKGTLFNFRANTMRIKHENTLFLENSLSNDSLLEED